MKSLSNLFSPISIGSMTLMNRIVMAPMNSRLGNSDGTASQQLIDYFAARAEGGVGLIVLPSVSVDRMTPFKNNLVLWDDKFIPSFERVAQAVHSYGTKIIPQICHPAPGMGSLSSISLEDMRSMMEQFGDAARRAKESGCDGVQLHAAHARMLLGSSISALCNRRTDEYGGSIENRLRLLIEVIRHVKEKVGKDFPIFVRISGDELAPGGRGIRETQYIAPMLTEAGANALDISIGVFGYAMMGGATGTGTPPGVTVPLAKAIKQVVGVPVVAVGRINTPGYAEDIIKRDEADLVALGRALIADPQWPRKASEGRFEDIAPCIACNMGCGGMEGPFTCLINPEVGKESESILSKAGKPKKIMVVGGGPAGMEAARIAAMRGHNVTLVEKSAKLGGQLNLAAAAPMKQEIVKVVQYLSNQLKELGVFIELDREVTPEFVKNEKPDAVIVATGSAPLIPEIPGIKKDKILTAYEILEGIKSCGPGRVLIIGGGMVGCEVADLVSSPGYGIPGSSRSVTIIEMTDDICTDISGFNRESLLERLKSKGVRLITSAKVKEVLEDGVIYSDEGQEKKLNNVNIIILAMGAVSVDNLSSGIKDDSIDIHIIGDAKSPRRALEAIAEGAEIGRIV